MNKEQQKAAAARIMAKLGPITEEERPMYEMLMKTPEKYRPPTETGIRVCGYCGARFENTVDKEGKIKVTALEKFSDHVAEHNPGPDKWAEAHARIQAGKERKADQDT